MIRERPIVPSAPCATALGKFGDLTWNARSEGASGPGPNVWNPCNAWLDSTGLHLRVAQRNGVWTSAEVYTTETLGYGRFEFEVATRLDALDRNLVFGLFTYPGGALDGQHEIDIELSKFGSAAANANNLSYVVYPATKMTTMEGHCGLRWDSPAAASVHRFVWAPQSIAFQSFGGTAITSSSVPYRAWAFTPSGSFAISNGAWPLRMNLWLYGGAAPSNGLPFEVVISRVAYSTTLPPASSESSICS